MRSLAVTLLFILLIGPALLQGQVPVGDIHVEADGYGSSNSNALLDAKRNAVEQGIGVLLISETELQNFKVQKDVIISRTTGSVRKFEILKEEKLPDNTFYSKIRAVVSLASIKSDLAALKILLESMDRPRTMVVIKEENGSSAKSAIIDYLAEKEFELVDATTVAALMKKEEELLQRAIAGDPLASATIGASNGAEYVIVGEVTKSLMKSALLGDTGMKSGQANITVKVVNCSSGRIIASKSASSAAVHVSEDMAMAMASEKAAKKLMDTALFEKIVSTFQDMINNGIAIDVTVKNISNFRAQKAVRKVLGELANVVSVNKRSFGGGCLKLSVLYKGTTDSFSEAVDGKIVKGKKLQVTDMEGSRVVIYLE